MEHNLPIIINTIQNIGDNMDEQVSKFCQAFQELSASDIEWIQSQIYDRRFKNTYTQKQAFFEMNPQSTDQDYFAWQDYRMTHDWQTDIWFMFDEKDFMYHWPYIAAHILQYIED
ncbi:MAG TPA: hypothetical protein DCM40_39185 [Maribacter sp.]|nr:hypothetical protein [Maribacter sp.]